ncbi:hypothetical protein J7J26_02055 [Candidatus Micrarchaeota archaeon]|nr:hypothetical protein [Candidatus Micrarchaeota archaeon]
MISKKIKVKDRYFIEIPADIANQLSDELEIYSIKKGIAVITDYNSPKEKEDKNKITKIRKSNKLTAEEIDVLKKIGKIKFKERSPKHVNKIMTNKEKEILLSLIQKGIVSIYKGKHYAEIGGVYNIKDAIYPKVYSKNTSNLHIPDYLVINDQYSAKKFSSEYEHLIKRGKLIGIRGFDRKYYAVSKTFFDKYSGKIISTIRKSPMTPEQLSEKLSIPLGACTAVLLLLAEHGEVYQGIDKRFHIA